MSRMNKKHRVDTQPAYKPNEIMVYIDSKSYTITHTPKGWMFYVNGYRSPYCKQRNQIMVRIGLHHADNGNRRD